MAQMLLTYLLTYLVNNCALVLDDIRNIIAEILAMTKKDLRYLLFALNSGLSENHVNYNDTINVCMSANLLLGHMRYNNLLLSSVKNR